MPQQRHNKGSITVLKRTLCALLMVCCTPVLAKPSVVLILDDVGYRLTDYQALALPEEVAFSILPDTPLSKPLALKAHAQQRDVMLHLPMEAEAGNKLGPLALTTNMYPQRIAQTLREALQAVPYAIGINNHMGSKLTAERLPMQALMSALESQKLFFIDSRTTSDTLAESIAKQRGIPAGRRDVFLDHQQTDEFMRNQFARLMTLARRKGTAIGIAHPHPDTIKFLLRHLPELAQAGIELIPVSEYFAPQTQPQWVSVPSAKAVVAPN